MRLALVLVLVAVALGYYLYVTPLPFDAEVGPWEVQPNPERVGVLAPNTLLSKSSSLGQVGSPSGLQALSHVKVLTTVRPPHARFTAQRRWCLVPMAVFTAGRLTAGSLLLTAPRARWVPLTFICLLFSSADRPLREDGALGQRKRAPAWLGV